ncbi:MAG TPA: small multi-drug export protein [Candidatus Thermoplasmatota archaeon]|nr:small multi-drug export protein [Candidatus Thermoplasmatota archaeon]
MSAGPGSESAAPPADAWHRQAAYVGVAIWIVGLAGLAWIAVIDRTQATAALLSVVTFYYAGQFGAMPLGIAAGGHPVLIGAYVWAADVAGLLVFFPLTQLGVDRLAARRGPIARWIRGTQAHAHRRRAFIERYGPWGLFAFTSLPFLFNSPILGAALGRIAGLASRKTLAALLGAVSAMSVVWTVVFSYGLAAARAQNADLPWFFALGTLAVTFLVAGTLAVWHRIRRKPTVTSEPRSPPS